MSWIMTCSLLWTIWCGLANITGGISLSVCDMQERAVGTCRLSEGPPPPPPEPYSSREVFVSIVISCTGLIRMIRTIIYPQPFLHVIHVSPR